MAYKVQYYSVDLTGARIVIPAGTSPGAAIGGIFGGVAFLIIVVFIYKCCKIVKVEDNPANQNTEAQRQTMEEVSAERHM